MHDDSAAEWWSGVAAQPVPTVATHRQACLILVLVGAIWFRGRHEKTPSKSRLIPPWQRWSTYGTGAAAVGLSSMIVGVVVIIMGFVQ
jgi:hypothetical protein